jgi:uncharacterized lipoprotein YehR (DUF1307 family)
MKSMKKIISLLAVVLLAFSLTACGSQNANTQKKQYTFDEFKTELGKKITMTMSVKNRLI